MTLFDPATFGPGKPAPRPRRPPRAGTPNTEQDGTWLALRDDKGAPLPQFHRRKAAGEYGAIITVCGLSRAPITLDVEYPIGAPIVACEGCLYGGSDR